MMDILQIIPEVIRYRFDHLLCGRCFLQICHLCNTIQCIKHKVRVDPRLKCLDLAFLQQLFHFHLLQPLLLQLQLKLHIQFHLSHLILNTGKHLLKQLCQLPHLIPILLLITFSF